MKIICAYCNQSIKDRAIVDQETSKFFHEKCFDNCIEYRNKTINGVRSMIPLKEIDGYPVIYYWKTEGYSEQERMRGQMPEAFAVVHVMDMPPFIMLYGYYTKYRDQPEWRANPSERGLVKHFLDKLSIEDDWHEYPEVLPPRTGLYRVRCVRDDGFTEEIDLTYYVESQPPNVNVYWSKKCKRDYTITHWKHFNKLRSN